MKPVKVSFDMPTLPLVRTLCLVAVFASVASAQTEPRVGKWELNLAKSTFSPGPPPKRQTLTFHAAGPHWVALLQGTDASGMPINPDMNNLAINFDGKDHPTANADYDTTAWKRIDANTYVANERYKSVPGAALRLGNLPAMINADVHSGEDVILTATGPGSERVRGQMENTEVFRVIAEALGLGSPDAAELKRTEVVPRQQ